ncbi:MAG: medium chain dehydrogenase/reductase family protein [Myxococcaceae bacterium]
MKSLYITRYGGPDVLQLREEADPSPAAGKVRIRVQRAGLNFAEVSARVGLYPDAPKPPMVAGYEVSGVVDALGSGATRVREGDRVLAFTHFGGHSDTVIVDEIFAARLPEAMSFEEAAALPVNYLTAFHMLFHVHVLKPGEKVLVHSAAGGVGQAVIQLSKQVEDVELFGTASASKHAFLREAGVHHPIDYRSVDYAEEVRRLTQGRGVDLVLDALGGPDWSKGYDLLAPAGQLICFGWANMVQSETRNVFRVVNQLVRQRRFAPMGLMEANRTVSGVNMGRMWSEAALLHRHLDRLLELYENGRIKPHVDKVFALSQAADAHRYMQERRNVGKIVFDCTR